MVDVWIQARRRGKEVFFHASPIEPVAELCGIALEVLVFDRVVGSEQEALQVRQRDVNPREELVRRLALFGDLDGGMSEGWPTARGLWGEGGFI
jgi:hypothetical protein